MDFNSPSRLDMAASALARRTAKTWLPQRGEAPLAAFGVTAGCSVPPDTLIGQPVLHLKPPCEPEISRPFLPSQNRVRLRPLMLRLRAQARLCLRRQSRRLTLPTPMPDSEIEPATLHSASASLTSRNAPLRFRHSSIWRQAGDFRSCHASCEERHEP